MEYRTKVTAVSTVLAVLCLTAVFGTVFSQSATTQRQAQEPLLAGYDPSAVTGLEFADGVVLTKAGSWSLTAAGKQYPVAVDRVENYVKTLAQLKKDRLASSGDPKPFGLDQGFKTMKVLGAEGKPVAELDIGGMNDGGDKVYVRFKGAKEIWETEAGFSRNLGLGFNTWADLTLFPPKKTPVRIAFDSRVETSDKTVYSPFDLISTQGKDGKPAWQNRLTKATVNAGPWADNFPSFHFGAFALPTDPPAKAKLGTLTVGWSDGSETKVTLGTADAQNRYRASDGSKEFWINDWALGQLLYK